MTGPRSFSRASSASKLMPSSTPASKLSSVRGAGLKDFSHAGFT